VSLQPQFFTTKAPRTPRIHQGFLGVNLGLVVQILTAEALGGIPLFDKQLVGKLNGSVRSAHHTPLNYVGRFG
jgi:hypothetical protein